MVLVRDVDPSILLKGKPRGSSLGLYLPRDIDGDLRSTLSTARFTLIVFETNSGARRSAYEALLAVLPQTELIVEPEINDLALDRDAAPAVIWLDNKLPQVIGREPAIVENWLARDPARRVLGLVGASNFENPNLRRGIDRLRPAVHRIMPELSTKERTTAERMHNWPHALTIEELTRARVTNAAAVPDPFAAHVADYRPDTDDGVDRLGIGPDVRMLADLVVSRMITPPLSIGLFGSWGSGKSFFMRQMQLRVRELADSAQEAETVAGAHGKAVSSYCSSVRQISFNAWHYSEANLLASLATHIFDNLAASGAENDLQRQADALAERRKTEKTLLGRLSAVRLERRTLTAQQKQAKRRRRKPRDYVRAVFDSLTDADKAWIASRLGVERPTAEDLERLAQETGGLRSDVAEFWRRLRQDPVPLLILIGGLVTVLVVTLLVGRTQVSGVLGGLTLASSALTVVLRMRASAGRIHEALGKLGGPSEEDEETERRLAELDAESERLEKAVTELAPGLDLVSFAESRVSDYVEHLGVVSLLRKDLETFATMLAEVPHGSGKIERTVLYIDDLDRCPPKVVVQVLEAIHLLLALPVFVVVVGVDSRWLKRAVEQHYEEMLGDDPETFAENYLEKIFQVPFTLSPMDDPGFAGLVRGLAATEGQDATPVSRPAEADQATESRSPAVSGQAPPPEEAPEPSSEQSTIDLRPPRLVISLAELDFLATLAPLVRSPRAAKRLLNLYRLLRARLAGEDLAEFLADGDREAPFRAVLVLLSVLVGYPEVASWFFAALAGLDPDDSALEIVSSLNDHELRPKVERGLVGGSWPELAVSYQRWLPLVNRFSFARDD
ncbi:P-loop NTPase fold protein [Amycolatopsis sp. BJA-103]|uniref:P-loop NTPase fold protein n=1 Tax=Amycolatopsis sp. BJA-103 TaxID=1911175 RepID=UPI000C77FDBD|nr:P-loop NTPase fold protein [Amycolatopsis sp. BJA-103]AUI58537.1 NTPase [Amycolatopsis sp. BJA-103]PNE15216.1 NTPase [Amycolatopsis sp. BJA-103]